MLASTLLPLSLLTTFVPYSLFATSFTYIGTTGGDWNTDSNWNPFTSYPQTFQDSATFAHSGGMGTSTNLSSAISLNAITFSGTTGFQITNSSSLDTITFSTGSTITSNNQTNIINPPLILESTLSVVSSSGGVLELQGISDNSTGSGINFSLTLRRQSFV
jgi:hypothetical protein